ncbi:MAG: protein kinase [Deltaproteobacteria bacterium]|nr:protein kinase [Deltaproteobacteria bacterium]
MIGETVSHFKVVEKIGHGGMGVVYRAEDLRLKRWVALKFLPIERLDDESARERFLQEAQSASVLDHPNICTIFAVDELPSGRPFFAMGYYEGETLRERIDRLPLTIQEAIEISLQVARGLEEAHRQGIIHRDIKPENLMLTPDGVVKILDFGVAKAAGTKGLTQAGKALGTTSYMPPEALRGQGIDLRGDIWSLGVVLYEMINGSLPFSGESQGEMILSILTDTPSPMREHRRPESNHIEAVLERALQKDPAARYQTIPEMAGQLQSPAWRPASETLSLRGVPEVVSQPTSIAVLPFSDLSADQDQDYFCCGLAEELIHLLTRVPGLRVVSRTSAAQFLGKAVDIRKIGRELNVDTVLEGSVRKAVERLRITVKLSKVSDGYHLWSERYDREAKDLFEVQDDIARMVVESLEVTLSGERSLVLEVDKPGNLNAYHLYLKGRYHWSKRTESQLEKGIGFFQAALDEDPTYARALAGLADSFAVLGVYGAKSPGEVMPKSSAAAEQALQLDASLAEVYAAQASVRAAYDWDYLGAAELFRHAIRLRPSYPTAYHWYANHCLIPAGRFDEALTQLRRALRLDPLSLAINVSVGLCFFYSRAYQRAVKEFEQALEMEGGFAIAHLFLGQALGELGQHEDALREVELAIQLSGGSPEMTAVLGYLSAKAGRGDKAEGALAELRELAQFRYVSPVLMALVQVGMGRTRQALEALDEGLAGRSTDLIWLAVKPAFDPLRSNPRFQRLLEAVGLKPIEVDAPPLQQSTLEV